MSISAYNGRSHITMCPIRHEIVLNICAMEMAIACARTCASGGAGEEEATADCGEYYAVSYFIMPLKYLGIIVIYHKRADDSH